MAKETDVMKISSILHKYGINPVGYSAMPAGSSYSSHGCFIFYENTVLLIEEDVLSGETELCKLQYDLIDVFYGICKDGIIFGGTIRTKYQEFQRQCVLKMADLALKRRKQNRCASIAMIRCKSFCKFHYRYSNEELELVIIRMICEIIKNDCKHGNYGKIIS